MRTVNNRILVEVNMAQKDTMIIDGVVLSSAIKFETNYREKSPVIAKVMKGNQFLKQDDILLVHHNSFYAPSPYQVEDNIFSIPFNKTIFAKINKNGSLSALCGNVLGERIKIETTLPVPAEHQKKYVDRLLIKDKGWTSFKNGTVVICKPNAPYDIVYNIGGIERRVTKLDSEQIVGYLNSK